MSMDARLESIEGKLTQLSEQLTQIDEALRGTADGKPGLIERVNALERGQTMTIVKVEGLERWRWTVVGGAAAIGALAALAINLL
tara:strand:- start:1135 stop:1389 length:255 start_codon:yes stop_codon:yes gene_type:complete